ncbi:MAG: type II CAAX endopeptidase family protein [Oscillospiraceae bacterium]|nr:type II CAAX endopeptidase family protein [Oscillospiraceae bacterium]
MTKLKKPLLSVLMIYGVCFVFRWIEYFHIRTDKTFVGEAVLHKLIGIAVLCIALKLFSSNPAYIGFTKKRCLKHLFMGLLFGISVFVIGYGAEILLAVSQGCFPSLQLYVSSYAVIGNVGNQTGLIFFIICVTGNIVNVLMEESIFRGLFQKILQQKYSFTAAAVTASLLFGSWHVIGPVRNYVDGISSMGGMAANILMLVMTSALGGFKFAMITKLTGSLYMAMGDHFVNNTIVNMLHVVSSAGADEWMTVRMAAAQTVSFLAVLIVYMRKQKQAYVIKDSLTKTATL